MGCFFEFITCPNQPGDIVLDAVVHINFFFSSSEDVQLSLGGLLRSLNSTSQYSHTFVPSISHYYLSMHVCLQKLQSKKYLADNQKIFSDFFWSRVFCPISPGGVQSMPMPQTIECILACQVLHKYASLTR